MGKMLNAFLAIHGRCKFIIFLRGQTPSLSAPTLILSLMEHFQGKAKNTVKHSIKSTFSISIQLNCNWLPGNPQLPPYIYIHVCVIPLNIEWGVKRCDARPSQVPVARWPANMGWSGSFLCVQSWLKQKGKGVTFWILLLWRSPACRTPWRSVFERFLFYRDVLGRGSPNVSFRFLQVRLGKKPTKRVLILMLLIPSLSDSDTQQSFLTQT